MAYKYDGQQKRGKRIIAYTRVSAVMGRGDDLISPEVQEGTIRNLAKREGLEVVDVVVDLDLSGRSSKKRAIIPIIDRIARNEADGVAVWKLDRWGRNTLESLMNIRELHAAGGFIVSASENLDDIQSPMGRFTLTQMLAIAELQSNQIGETWRDVREYRLANGKPSTGGKRWGYVWDQDGDCYSIDPDVESAVRRAYESYVAGVSFGQIVDQLRAASQVTPSGSEWTTGKLRQTLDTGFSAGLLVRYPRNREGKIRGGVGRNEYLPGAHDPIISRELWGQYCHQRASVKAPPRSVNAVHRLSGLVKCATCGSTMTLTQAGRKDPDAVEVYRYFRCNRSHRLKHAAGTRCIAPAQIRDLTVDDAVREWVFQRAENGIDRATAMQRDLASRKADGSHKSLTRDIAKLEKRMATLLEMRLDGEITKEQYTTKHDEMDAALTELRRQQQSAATSRSVNKLPEVTAFSAVYEGWDRLSPATLRTALQHVIARVEVGPAKSSTVPRIRVVGAWEVEPVDLVG